MSLTISEVSPRDPRAKALLRGSYALMQRIFGPEDNLALDIEGLCAPQITLWLAQRDGTSLGCVALRRAAAYGEVKSFYVTPEARGQGVGSVLLAHLERAARAEGLPCLRLETGAGLEAAQRLYEAAGYRACGPFGGYADTGVSLFFEKPLSR